MENIRISIIVEVIMMMRRNIILKMFKGKKRRGLGINFDKERSYGVVKGWGMGRGRL